jgi:hypothetical protein
VHLFMPDLELQKIYGSLKQTLRKTAKYKKKVQNQDQINTN